MVKKATLRSVKKVSKKKVTKNKVILPRVMSELITIALRDLRKVEKQPKKFTVDMNTYFDPNEKITCMTSYGVAISSNATCLVCAAGSVMALSLGMENSKKLLDPICFPENTDQLYAIDRLRVGAVFQASGLLGIAMPKGVREFYAIPRYDNMNPEPFHKAMEELRDTLKAKGA